MYKFNTYWTPKLGIDFLQRVILIHSYLYYQADKNIWTDKKWDEIAKQLTAEQTKQTVNWIKQKTQYGYAFYDFDGTTGFDLWERLTNKDKVYIQNLAERIE